MGGARGGLGLGTVRPSQRPGPAGNGLDIFGDGGGRACGLAISGGGTGGVGLRIALFGDSGLAKTATHADFIEFQGDSRSAAGLGAGQWVGQGAGAPGFAGTRGADAAGEDHGVKREDPSIYGIEGGR